jgi:hypothetical protein
MKCSPDIITELKPNEIFVFGSNLAGRHGAGAALLAKEKFGARLGWGKGLYGQSYALPTKSLRLKTLSLERINLEIIDLLTCAVWHPLKIFLVTEIGCGLAGYQPKDIAPLFFRHHIPENVLLPRRFEELRPLA